MIGTGVIGTCRVAAAAAVGAIGVALSRTGVVAPCSTVLRALTTAGAAAARSRSGAGTRASRRTTSRTASRTTRGAGAGAAGAARGATSLTAACAGGGAGAGTTGTARVAFTGTRGGARGSARAFAGYLAVAGAGVFLGAGREERRSEDGKAEDRKHAGSSALEELPSRQEFFIRSVFVVFHIMV